MNHRPRAHQSGTRAGLCVRLLLGAGDATGEYMNADCDGQSPEYRSLSISSESVTSLVTIIEELV